ncbi:MAG: D-glycero-beta-D-manno-heptose-7-phosphate kinase [Candidatus Omnitrophota bacterium]|mgnify:CR=1 FL=1|nr:MAG: D-glycero-beta-D-manno-heptose-7-phosphate kinase [Candidatus Omnitrophota bacterium]HDN86352.1 D-glycero-beta-D-manno-heptose-7-phosphate kinase [Candidatus Omnitrophota bacterium]
MKVSKVQLRKLIRKWKGKKILVIGDLILDHYIFGQAERISPEAPVPVICASQEKFLGGGAVNVAFNLIDLGAKVTLCGIVGKDYFGDTLLSFLKKRGMDTSLIFTDKYRPTTLKTRIIAQHQQVVRVDWESKEFLHLELSARVLKKIKKAVDMVEGVIIEDYGKGMINSYLVENLVKLCKKRKKVITVDPKENHFSYYEDVTALTPNLKEAEIAANMRLKSREEINLLGRVILDELKPQALLITLGEEGMRLFLKEGGVYHIPTYALEVYDVTGAGDTVIAVFTLALLGGASFLEASVISNLAAGVVVGKLGASTTNCSELLRRMKNTDIKIYKIK